MLEIYFHQLHDHLRSLRFQASLVVLLLFFVANGVLYTFKADRVDEETKRLESENNRRYEEVTDLGSAVDATYRFLLRPLGTEFISEGGAHWFYDTGFVTPATGQGIAYLSRRAAVNHWMDRFELLDWTLIARVVLSFLALVLAYDGLSGERERGTLSLMLANPLSRGSVLVGKFMAHLTVLVAALLLGTVVSLLILSLGDAVHLDGRVVAGCGLFLLGSALYAALFLLIGLGVSALARTSATSLVVLVLIWAVLIVALPQAAYLIGVRAVSTPEWDELDENKEQVESALAREGIALRGRDAGRADNYVMEKEWARRMAEGEKVRRQMYHGFEALETRQFELTRSIALLSPGYAFQSALEAVLGTGLVRHLAFQSAFRNYLEVLRDFIRARDAADAQSPHILFVADYLSDRSLDHRDIPRFAGVKLTVADGIAGGWSPLALLIAEATAAFFFALWAMNRASVVDRG